MTRESYETLTYLEKFQAPWGKEISLKNVDYESGLKMLRIIIRERNRFTLVDLDTETALRLAKNLSAWAEDVSKKIS